MPPYRTIPSNEEPDFVKKVLVGEISFIYSGEEGIILNN